MSGKRRPASTPRPGAGSRRAGAAQPRRATRVAPDPACTDRPPQKAGRADPGREQVVVPVVQEELVVGRRTVDRGGVRVTKVVTERDEVVDLPIEREDVRIERVAMDREVDGPVPAREENGVIVLSVVEEVIVVQKKWVLREEVRISRQRGTAHRPRRVTLRSEKAVVERLPPIENPAAGAPGAGPAGGPYDHPV
jgi:uncharacterized protein (TIGR02271 family)